MPVPGIGHGAGTIIDIQQDGGVELEVTVRLDDPNDDALIGVIRIVEPRAPIVLEDFFFYGDCSQAMPPEFIQDAGVVFILFPFQLSNLGDRRGPFFIIRV